MNDRLAELRACPFCGGKPLIHRWKWGGQYGHVNASCGCGVEMSIERPDAVDAEERILRKWNRRCA